MQKIFKTAIVGGGAAGLLSAVELLDGAKAFKGEDVLVLERNDRVGKKLIATGNGQGNLTNENFGEEFYYGNKDFIKSFVMRAKEIDVKEYLYKLGIPLIASKDGKMFPLSKQASAVLDVIRAYLEHKRCVIETGKRVTRIEKNADGYVIFVEKEKFYAKTVIVATGGSAGKQFGTDGSAYKLVQSLGHKLTEVYPSLVQLKTETDKIKGLKGLKEYARVTAFSGRKPLKSATGDVLFTEYGVSGNAVFQVSACIAGVKDAYLIIEFLPDFTYSQTENILEIRKQKRFINEQDLLCGILNKKIGQAILKATVGNDVKDVAYTIKNFKLKVTGSLDFNYAQVTRGGVVTDSVNPLTMESKLCNGLYIVGEMLDVDGDCGGYNLTFAFVSGITAARSIKGIYK